MIAKVKIKSIQQNRCIANVMPGWKLSDVMEGAVRHLGVGPPGTLRIVVHGMIDGHVAAILRRHTAEGAQSR